ncbi:acyltransferase [Sulfitobacter sp. 1A13496]|uniref:acyltransferase n=1 Tax=Sulfitobacter sp. 1A13496 TaxID=3368596 RepID=UPI003746955A
MAENTRVGHFNLIQVKRLLLKSEARLGHMNFCRGPVSLRLGRGADLGNRNTVSRAPRGVTFGSAQLWLGQGAKITAGHTLDCTQSIQLGNYATLAGKNSQIWTHGYVHEDEAPKRYRVDGRVIIGNNVYLGSSVIVTGGVLICNGVSVGVGSCVTKHLTEPGFYVSGELRMLPKPVDPESRSDMERVTAPELIETVYRKHDASP